MTDDDIIEILTRVMRQAFRKPDLEFAPRQELRDIFGIDSVQFVTLMLTLEEQFDVLLPEDRVDQLSTVQSLFDLIRDVIARTEGAAS